MTDREAMIEVMNEMGVMIPESARSSRQDCADVADRLIEAGFGKFVNIGELTYFDGLPVVGKQSGKEIEEFTELYVRKE